MEIGTNELTRPFRIPRKKAGEEISRDGDDKLQTKRKRIGGDSELRSPLLVSGSTRKNDGAFSSRIIPPAKRKTSQDNRGANLKKGSNKTPSGGEVFDKIIGNMVNPPKERKLDISKEREEVAGPSGTASSSRIPQRGVRQLTREELERQHVDNSACYAFLRKEGLMERLLGHKMLTGRVDSHVALGYLPFDPSEQAPRKQKSTNMSSFDDFPTICEPPPVAVATEERRGPRTPPGSPGHEENSSLISSRGAGSLSPSTPPPPPPEEDLKKEQSGPADLIAEMAELTKLPHNQLAECLGEELQNAMKQVDHAVLLSTLKDALMKVGKKSEVTPESSKSPPVIKKEETVTSTNAVAVTSPPVEMDIESDKSANAGEQMLPPPPPAPCTPPAVSHPPSVPLQANTVTVMPPLSCVLPTPPPPPPPVVLQSAQHPTTITNVNNNPVSNIVTIATPSPCRAFAPPSFSRPPPVQFVASQPPPPISVGTCEVRPPSPNPKTAPPQSFATLPPPVIPNTAVPPPSFTPLAAPPPPVRPQAVANSLLGPPPSAMPGLLPPPAMPSTSVASMPAVRFPSSASLASGVNRPAIAVKSENTALRPSLLTPQIDFSKPPPLALPVAPQISQQNSASHTAAQQPTFSAKPPTVNIVNSTSISHLRNAEGSLAQTSDAVAPPRLPNFSKVYKSSETDRLRRDTVLLPQAVPTTVLPSPTTQIRPPSNVNSNIFAQNKRPPILSEPSASAAIQPPSQILRPPVPSEVVSTPTSQNVIRTLLSALAIPRQSPCSPPPLAAQKPAVTTSIDLTQPPPGGSIVVDKRSCSPVLLDRYGCPLPVPTKRVGDHINREPMQSLEKAATVQSNEDHSAETNLTLSRNQWSTAAEETNDVETDVVDFSWPPANFDEEKRNEKNIAEEPISFFGTKSFFPPIPGPSSSARSVGTGADQKPPQGQLRGALFTPNVLPPPVLRPRFEAEGSMKSAKLHPLINSVPFNGTPAALRPPLPNVPFRMRGPPPFLLRRPPPPFGQPPLGGRMVRPPFRR